MKVVFCYYATAERQSSNLNVLLRSIGRDDDLIVHYKDLHIFGTTRRTQQAFELVVLKRQVQMESLPCVSLPFQALIQMHVITGTDS